jgi:hypothetical protein
MDDAKKKMAEATVRMMFRKKVTEFRHLYEMQAVECEGAAKEMVEAGGGPLLDLMNFAAGKLREVAARAGEIAEAGPGDLTLVAPVYAETDAVFRVVADTSPGRDAHLVPIGTVVTFDDQINVADVVRLIKCHPAAATGMLEVLLTSRVFKREDLEPLTAAARAKLEEVLEPQPLVECGKPGCESCAGLRAKVRARAAGTTAGN